ncbi:MAG: hypothetical protein PHW21_07415 [Candidatus Izemoplasmatales bacterium]|jgi:hypothetical protein|nr:hypothetical protein [Candidatus Izemoplasmatales bacterium]
MKNEIIVQNEDMQAEHIQLFNHSIGEIREDIRYSPYILEAVRVLKVNGLRSAIGQFWNAVVDDLRRKIIYRSLDLFNKESSIGRTISTYEDFQDHVNDFQLIEGAYKIGVIGLEAKKVLHHARDTRNIFSAHPESSEPSHVKVLSMMEDCIKYVLSQDFPPKIVILDDYINIMSSETFNRDEYIISNTFADLPKIYKNELANRFMTSYIHEDTPMTLKSNIEFSAPLLWNLLPKDIQIQTARRVDQEIQNGDAKRIDNAFKFIDFVNASRYLSRNARISLLRPIIKKLNDNLDTFRIENECVTQLSKYSEIIPSELLFDYVNGLTQTYVGRMHGSIQFSRKDFFADLAAQYIPDMFSKFSDIAVEKFIEVLQQNTILKDRIKHPIKLRRLRTLGDIARNKATAKTVKLDVLDFLVDEDKEEEFLKIIK